MNERLSRALAVFESLCFVGHTHLSGIVDESGQIEIPGRDNTEYFPNGRKALVDVDSVGWPRAEDPRAGYVLYDSAAGAVRFRRVVYDVEATARTIEETPISDIFAARLRHAK
jgi:diadenosine tetraphosphatase ApaH/serine/threonine PP2A family protein phosphatase